MSPESATARVARLLTMVPWLLQHPGVPIEDAAREFDVTVPQLESDLELLFVCGTPGGMPDDLIEADWESGSVYLGNADAIARPLRLGLDEALMLIVALRTIAATPELGDRDVVDRVLAKLVTAIGSRDRELADSAARRIQVEVADAEDVAQLAAARDALQRRRRIHLRYLNANRDEATERDVDPMRVLAQDGHWYLEGWCHRADGVRLFRLDRVDSFDVLDVDGTPPPQAVSRDLSRGAYSGAPDDRVVTLLLRPRARWVAEYYPTLSQEEVGEDLRVRLTARDDAWLARLVLGCGGHAVLEAPQPAVDAVRARALAALSGYPA